MEKKPLTVQQAKESVKIDDGPSYVFFLLCSKREMADAGVGVFVWRMNNCRILALVYMGGKERED